MVDDSNRFRRGGDEMWPELPITGEHLSSPVSISRRSALKLMGASLALAMGMTGCERKPERKIISRHSGPEYQLPGEALYYSSTWTGGRVPYGMVVKTVDGRPVKIEGHPDHPLNRGKTDLAMQASILSLYDPDRLKSPRRGGSDITWREADEAIASALADAASVVLLTRANPGPSERDLIDRFIKMLPQTRRMVYESVHDGLRRSAWQKVFGQDGEIIPLFDQAKVILSVESDFLGTDGAVLENIRRFTDARRVAGRNPRDAAMSRLYAAEGAMTVTGSKADHRLPLRPSKTLPFLQALRSALGGNTDPLTGFARENHQEPGLLEALARDLWSHPGESLVVAGPHMPESVHAEVLRLNRELKAFQKTVAWNPVPAEIAVTDPSEIKSVLQGEVDVFISLGVNPGYDWPEGGFDALIRKAGLSVGHGLYDDETLSACQIALPSSHNLESWNDASPGPGVYSLCQPVIAPLNQARQEAHSLLTWMKMLDDTDPALAACRDWHDFVRRHWLERISPGAADSEARWEDALRSGLVENPVQIEFPEMNEEAAESIARSPLEEFGAFELILQPDPAIHDGRFANNAWLQELPDAVSKLVWDNAACLSPADSGGLNIQDGDIVKIKTDGGEIDLPALIQPGIAEGVITVYMGYGRTRAGQVGSGVGVNAAPLLKWGVTPRLKHRADLSKTGRSHRLVRTQKHFSQEGRPLAIHGTLAEYQADPDFVQHRQHHPRAGSMYKPYDYSKGHKWFLAIDLTACIGCGACTIACQAENNIPVVGKTECGMGREMHWIRVDQYLDGDSRNPAFLHQPLPCQQCDNAPCENVCPVNATTHSAEGLKQMVYNRCVGTRYCSNNCPYKVRRFNFFDYQKRQLKAPEQELVFNPQVTVRSRGVMEKCTFCIQRINEAKFKAKNKGRPIPDGSLITACQAACPAGAIMFGDVNDRDSAVNRWRKSRLAYHLLGELNTEPSVAYLASVRNRHDGAPDTDPGGHA